MKILLCSVPFRPSIGGIETISGLLADQFTQLGHEVCVVTQTPGESSDESYAVMRRPNAITLARAIAASDVVLHNNISLRLGWPQMLVRRKPWVIAHHVWTPATGVGRLKRIAMTSAHNISVSGAIAQSLPVPSVIIPNPYAEDLFFTRPDVRRDRDIVFLGRLVSDKGLVHLIDALAILRRDRISATLTIIGSGPEEGRLRQQTAALHLDSQINFAGRLQGRTLIERLNTHRILAVPSVWEEPFGIVVLEGLACGLVPVVTRSGGLPEALGDCGLVVPKSDAIALAEAMRTLLCDDSLRATLATRAPAHLARHTRRTAAVAYLEVLQSACDRTP